MQGRKTSDMKKTLLFILPVVLCFAVGGVSAAAMAGSLKTWYPFLVKPALTPPGMAFPIAWSIIYLLAGLSAGLVLTSHRTSHRTSRRTAMTLWFAQLLLNMMWSFLFFAFRLPWAAFADIVLLAAALVLYMIFAWRHSRAASLLFIPYLCWTLFATYLNAYIAVCN